MRWMSTNSRERLFGSSIAAAAEKAKHARDADLLACPAWKLRMLGYRGPAQPSPTIADALNARLSFLEVKCLGCEAHSTVDLTIVCWPKETPVHEFERWCKNCSKLRGYPYKQSHLIAADDKDIRDRPAHPWVSGRKVVEALLP